MDTKLFSRLQEGGMFTVLDKEATPGDIYYVDSGCTTGADAVGYGRNPDAAFLTLDYAIGIATADQGDVIIVMPGHAETLLAADVTVDKADLTIIGLGQGKNKPTFTFTATTNEFNVTADDVTIRNLRMVSGINDLAVFIDADAHNLILEDIDFETSNTFEAFCFVDFATTKDWLTIRRCTALQPTDPAGTDAAAGTGFLFCIDSQQIILEDCLLAGQFETSTIHNRTTACNDLWIKGCYFRQLLNGAEHINLVNTSTGAIHRSVSQNINSADVAVANIVGAPGQDFWLGGDAWWGNDSGGGGQLMVVGDAATT